MGIKGIYGEIGPGDRQSLAKLAIKKYEETGRPLRIAIDISIWQFQIQSGKGGSNPALRTLYYRLLRLLSLPMQPLFVFDGTQKPPFKRNKSTNPVNGSLPNVLTKKMLNLFGFSFHSAPGEAEAECALLQREGIVDAVLSEDVDTLMFGCTLTLRNWSSEGSRGHHSPTHVSVYDAVKTKEGKSGLDREGMVLVALMSGGDYIMEGIPGCGIKLACEAARAGYGKTLCKLSKSEGSAIDTWRKELVHEILTNEKGHFRVKHKTLKIPQTFPDKAVLGYYTHPVVSSASELKQLRETIKWDGAVDVLGLRIFVAETFAWTRIAGARKFTRGLAPALLVAELQARACRRASGHGDVIIAAMNEIELVRSISGRRIHFSTDGMPELCLTFVPAQVVGLDLAAELDDTEDTGTMACSRIGENDTNMPSLSQSDDDAITTIQSVNSNTKRHSTYNPTEIHKAWVLETIAKVGVPLTVEDYEESLRNPKQVVKLKGGRKLAREKGGMPTGALEKYVKISKLDRIAQAPDVTRKKPTPHSVPSTGCTSPALNNQNLPKINYVSDTRSHITQCSHVRPDPNINKSKSKCRLQSTEEAYKPRTRSKKKPNFSNPWEIAVASSQGKENNAPRARISKAGQKSDVTHDISLSNLPEVTEVPSHLHFDPLLLPPRTSKLIHDRPGTPEKKLEHQALPYPSSSSSPQKKRREASPAECGLARFSHLSGAQRLERPQDRSLSSQHNSGSQCSPNEALPTLQDLLSPTPKTRPLRCQADMLAAATLNNSETEAELKASYSARPPSLNSANIVDQEKSTCAGKSDEEVIQQISRFVPASTQRKRLVVLRDSLDGSWKEVIAEDHHLAPGKAQRGAVKRRVWRASDLEIVDLTTGD